MAQVKAVSVLLILASAMCVSFAQDVAERAGSGELTSAGGHERGLKGPLLALAVKKHLVKRAIVRGAFKLFLAKALVLKAKLLFLKFKALGLLALLASYGIEHPEDVVYETDLGSACNVALDLGISCTELAKDEPQEVQEALHKMYNVVYYVEDVATYQPVEYLQCEVEVKESHDVQYYILKEDGTKVPYQFAHGDQPVEYVYLDDGGNETPYHGHIEVVVNEHEYKEEHAEETYHIAHHSHDGSKGDVDVRVALPEKVKTTVPEKIAVDTYERDGKVEYLRYKPQENVGVEETEALAAFKMKLLENVSQDPKFEQRDGIYVARMVSR